MLTLRDILRRELSEHFPLAANATFQGILLSPYNSQIPLPYIVDVSKKNNFSVLSVQNANSAELYPYISKRNDPGSVDGSKKATDKTKQTSVFRQANFSYLENLMIHNALQERVQDVISRSVVLDEQRTGIHINYVLSEQNEYAVWKSEGSHNHIIIKAETDEWNEKTKQALQAIGLEQKFRVEAMPAETPLEPEQ